MKSEFTFFTKEAVLAFLGNHGREKTKDYEFAAALIVHRLCEKQWGKDCWIGVRIKSKYSSVLPAYNSQREITSKEIAEFLSRGVDEDSVVDFVIAKKARMQKAQGMIFQVKRFGIGRNKKDTDELVTYLNSFSKKYGKTHANLLICLDDWVNVNMDKLYAGFNADKFPFNRLLFTWLDKDSAYLSDVYPKGNTEKYTMAELIAID
mgnify:FL=1